MIPGADARLPDEALPNILLISHPCPQSVTAGGILMHRMLKDYPPEKLLYMGIKPTKGASLLQSRYEHLTGLAERFYWSRFARWKWTVDAVCRLPRATVGDVQSRLRGFAPQVVVSILELGYHQVAWRFARSRGLPLVLIVHDRNELFEVVFPWAERYRFRNDREVYRRACIRLCVSPEMEAFYRDYYGEPGDVLLPIRSNVVTPRPLEMSAELRQPPMLQVGYAGTLGYGYGKQLSRMIPSFREAGAMLRLYGSFDWSKDHLFAGARDVVVPRGLAAPEQTWERVKQECDAVILPYQFGAEKMLDDSYRIHFPSKLTEYTSLRVPIILLGPAWATGVRWGLRNPGAAMTLTDDNPQAWRSALLELKNSPALRTQLAGEALAAGRRDFDPEQIRHAFKHHLVRAAAGECRRRTNPSARSS
jgi:glycosyltransferase involved in cell wall biosynthesis